MPRTAEVTVLGSRATHPTHRHAQVLSPTTTSTPLQCRRSTIASATWAVRRSCTSGGAGRSPPPGALACLGRLRVRQCRECSPHVPPRGRAGGVRTPNTWGCHAPAPFLIQRQRLCPGEVWVRLSPRIAQRRRAPCAGGFGSPSRSGSSPDGYQQVIYSFCARLQRHKGASGPGPTALLGLPAQLDLRRRLRLPSFSAGCLR